MSLQSWHKRNACVSQQEMAFLGYREDLLCLAEPEDGLLSWLERHASERILSWSKASHQLYTLTSSPSHPNKVRSRLIHAIDRPRARQ